MMQLAMTPQPGLMYMPRNRNRGPKKSDQGQNRNAKENTHADNSKNSKARGANSLKFADDA
jgi:hypothetical protein